MKDGNAMVEELAISMARLAVSFADWLQPEAPLDAKELPKFDQLQILINAAQILPVSRWFDHDAIRDFRKLMEELVGKSPFTEELVEMEKREKQRQRRIPDLSILPGSPDYDRQKRRLSRG